MYSMTVSKTEQQILDELEELIIQSSTCATSKIGYIGNVNRVKSTFWVMDHIHMYRRSIRKWFYAYERFEGSIEIDAEKDQIILKGQFKLCPFFKITWCIWYVLLVLVWLLSFLSWDIEKICLVGACTVTMGLIGWGGLASKLKRGEKYHPELIQFLENAFGGEMKESWF